MKRNLRVPLHRVATQSGWSRNGNCGGFRKLPIADLRMTIYEWCGSLEHGSLGVISINPRTHYSVLIRHGGRNNIIVILKPKWIKSCCHRDASCLLKVITQFDV